MKQASYETRYPVTLENSLMCTGVTSRINIEYCTQTLGMPQTQDQMPLSESNGSYKGWGLVKIEYALFLHYTLERR